MAKKKKLFEESLQELQESLDEMSSGELGLEEMLERYAKAAQLMQECKASLEQADVRIREIEASVAGLEAGNGFS